jgi:hypothetical protein
VATSVYAMSAKGALSRPYSVRKVGAPFNFEVVDWVVLDNWHAAFERCDPTIFQHSTHHCIEREKQAPSLSRDRIPKFTRISGFG